MSISIDEINEIAKRIKLYIAYNEISRSKFSELVGVEKASIDKIFQKESFLSYANHRVIKAFLDRDDYENSRGIKAETGVTSEENLAALIGNHTLYSPNAERLNEIEAFGLNIYWNKIHGAAEAEAYGIDDLKVTFNVHLPRDDGRVFLKRSYHGWGVMYVLNPSRFGIMNGVALRMDSLNADRLAWEPILFPVVLKRVSKLEPYRNLAEDLQGYEEARNLIMSAVRGNLSTIAVWQHWEKKMSGNPAGGPTFQGEGK